MRWASPVLFLCVAGALFIQGEVLLGLILTVTAATVVVGIRRSGSTNGR